MFTWPVAFKRWIQVFQALKDSLRVVYTNWSYLSYFPSLPLVIYQFSGSPIEILLLHRRYRVTHSVTVPIMWKFHRGTKLADRPSIRPPIQWRPLVHLLPSGGNLNRPKFGLRIHEVHGSSVQPSTDNILFGLSFKSVHDVDAVDGQSLENRPLVHLKMIILVYRPIPSNNR